MKMIISILFGISACITLHADSWAGTWYRNQLHDGAEIVITNETSGSFHFTIEAVNGAHTGEMEGEAIISGSTARAVLEEDDEDRSALFTRSGKGLTLMTENCEGYFGGAGVLFDGEYTRQKVSEEILADTYLQGILETKGLVIKIKNELGSLFTSMVFCLHLVSDEKCIDPFPAKVIVGCVRGICPDMAAILMYTTDGQFYIAWYNGEGLSYVSPDARYKKKLPKTIARWMKQYEGVRVNFL